MFNTCDTSGDEVVQLAEFENFIEALNIGLKTKEVHALLNFLDIDKNHTVNRDEFLR